MKNLNQIEKNIISCQKCLRLRKYCKEIAQIKKKSFLNEPYWGKPVPGFGTPNAQILIVGLAPAAHGANRTGRMFTGDRSGEWLYRALFKAGFSNQPAGPPDRQSKNDGLKLNNIYITAAVKCAPPDNKPTPIEIDYCSFYLEEELKSLKQIKLFIALGKIAYDALWKHLKPPIKKPKFIHGCTVELAHQQKLILSYHPSQQNTFTGKLTEPLFDSIFSKARLTLQDLE